MRTTKYAAALLLALLLPASLAAQNASITRPIGRAGAAASVAIVLSTEDKAVLDSLDTRLTNISGYLDGLEGLVGTTNSTLTTIDGRVDGLETLVGTTNTNLSVIAGDTTDIEAAIELLDNTVGSVAPGTAAANSLLIGGVYNSTPPTLTNGQQASLQFDSAGNLKTSLVGTIEADLTVGAQPADDPHFVKCSDGAIAAPCLVTLSGTNNIATVTTLTGITNPVTVTDGSGALNVIVDSSATVTVTASNLDIQSGGADLLTTTQGTTIIGHLDGLEGFVDGIETLIGTSNTSLATIAGDTTDIETAIEIIDNAYAEVATDYATVRLTDGTNFLTPGTDYTHNAALTADSSTGPLGMLLAKDFDAGALPNVVSAEGDAVAGAASLYGVQYVMVVSEDGSLERGTSTTPFIVGDGTGALNVIVDSCTGCGSGTQYAHNAALTADSTSTTVAGFLAGDFDGGALPSVVSAEGDAVMGRASLYGIQYTMLVNEDGSLQYGTSTTPLVVGDGSGALNVIIDSSATLTVNAHAVTNAGTFAVQVDGNALTALQLIDDPVFTLGTSTYTEATSKGFLIGAVRRDADTTLVDTTNEMGPLQMDANGRLKVEAFSGETLPVSLASVPSHAVTNAGTFVVQIDGAALTALQLADDVVRLEDDAHSSGHAGNVVLGRRIDVLAASSGASGDYELFNMNGAGSLWTAPTPSTNGGLVPVIEDDLDESETEFVTGVHQLYAMWVTNTATATRWVRCYDDTAANVTVGSTTRVFEFGIPGNASDDILGNLSAAGFGVPFANAITCAATTGAGASNTGAPGASDVSVTLFYK